MRFQFPLYKLFLITAAYAVTFKVLAPPDLLCGVVAVIAGSAAGALIIAIRSWKAVQESVIVAPGSLVGVGFSFGCYFFFPHAGNGYARADEMYLPITVAVVTGAVAGSLLFSWASKR